MKTRYILTSFVLGLALMPALALVWNLEIGNTPAEAAPVAQVPVYRLYHYTFCKNYYSHTSALYLQNPTAAAANVALTFHDLSSGGDYEIFRTIPARGTLAMPAESVPELPDGALYSLVASSDQPIQSVVQMYHSISSGDKLASYRGVSNGSMLLYFGPFHKNWTNGSPIPKNSSIVVWNVSSSTAAISVDSLTIDGSKVVTDSATVGPGEQWTLNSLTWDELPDGFLGWVRFTADQPIVGWLHQFDGSGEVLQVYGPLESSRLPRALNMVDEGNGPRATTLFAGNTGSAAANATLNYYAADGALIHSSTFALPAFGATIIDLSEEDTLPTDDIWAVTLNSDQPLVLGEVYYNESARSSVGTYGIGPDAHLSLPRLTRTDGAHTVFSIQGLGSTDIPISIDYYDLTGTLVYSQTANVKPNGWIRYSQSQMSQLGDDFEGSAVVDSSQPLMAWVDEYVYTPCEPVSNVQISRMPIGDLFAGNTVRFTANATGTKPFSYTWTLKETPVGANKSTFEHTFDAAGAYTVGVTVTNDCAQGSDTIVMSVQEPASEQPDLSQSHKSASLTNVESGDHLTYTLFLRNTSLVTASAILTDPLPAHATYMSGSAQASDGNPITATSKELHWSGQIISGTPVVIEFAVEVLTPSVGTSIINAARLDDGLGNVILLEADAVYNPGYRLGINDGALCTHIPTVTLSLSWAVEDPLIEKMQISNDGGFGTGTGWIDVRDTYSNWLLDTYGNLRIPRTVYALFRDEEGKQYGPIQDDIIYDPNPPEVTQIEIVTQTTQGIKTMEGQEVIVRVTADDDNSGVAKVQISHSEDFGARSEFATTGSTTDIPWTLQPSGDVYVRVVDRAGNFSEVESGQGPSDYEIYLPLVMRNH